MIGIILFLVFGIKSLSEKTLFEHRIESFKYSEFEKFEYTNKLLFTDPNSVFAHCRTTSLKPIYKNNDLQIINPNNNLYSECIKLIRSAKTFIHIQMYLIHDGFFSRTIFAELISKAKQGIKIRFLYD
jgi:cardiolipin synthase